MFDLPVPLSLVGCDNKSQQCFLMQGSSDLAAAHSRGLILLPSVIHCKHLQSLCSIG